jgi:hypothetical protein
MSMLTPICQQAQPGIVPPLTAPAPSRRVGARHIKSLPRPPDDNNKTRRRYGRKLYRVRGGAKAPTLHARGTLECSALGSKEHFGNSTAGLRFAEPDLCER